MKRTTKLRELLQRPEVLIAPGATDPLVARLVERAGFESVYMSGSGTSLVRYGLPDIGLVTMTEMVGNARLIADAVTIPLIADADTGYGNPLNVRRTVREFERAGVAAIHLEDQVSPKKCGLLQGKRLIPKVEMVQKIRAACDVRTDRDFTIIARCDAPAVTGMEDALDRGRAYVEAGADALFIQAPRTPEEAVTVGRSFTIPLLFNISPDGKAAVSSVADLQRIGYKIVILPHFPMLAAIKAVSEVLTEIKTTGSTAGLWDRCAGFAEFLELAGLGEVQEAERRYGTPDAERTSI